MGHIANNFGKVAAEKAAAEKAAAEKAAADKAAAEKFAAEIPELLKQKLNARDFGAIDPEKMKGNIAYYQQQGRDKLLSDITGLNTAYDANQKAKADSLAYLKSNLNPVSYGRINPDQLSQYGDYYANKGISTLQDEVKNLNTTYAKNQAERDALVQSRLGALKTELNPTIFGRLGQDKLNEFGNYYADKGEDVLKKEAADLNNQFYKQFYDAQQKAPQAPQQQAPQQQFSQVGPVKTGAPNKVNPVQQVQQLAQQPQQGSQPMPQKARPQQQVPQKAPRQQSQQMPQKVRPQQAQQTTPTKVR